MIHAQNERTVILLTPVSTTDGGTATQTADTLGYDYATIDVCSTTSDATENNFSKLILAHGAVTNSFTAIAAFTGDDTTDGFTIGAADTSNPEVVARLNVDLTKYERYLELTINPDTTQTVWAHMRLGYKDETPTSAANMGVTVIATA